MKSELLHVLFYLSLNLKNSILSNHQPSPNRSFLELSSGRLLNLEFYLDNCNICFLYGRLDLALSLLDWLLKYCRLRLIFSCCTVITFDLCEVWSSSAQHDCERWTQNIVRAKQKILSIHLHSSLQKQAPHYWPLVLFCLKTLILLLPPQSTSQVFCVAASKFLGLLGKDHKQTQYLVVS